jgi:hypothetical protein
VTRAVLETETSVDEIEKRRPKELQMNSADERMDLTVRLIVGSPSMPIL